MKWLYKIIPLFFIALFGVELIAVFVPKHDKDAVFHVRDFGRLPALMNGRAQPLDSVARNTLLQIRATGDVPLEIIPSWQFWRHAKKLKSSEWLLEVLFKPEVADTRPIFLVHHPEVLSTLNLADKGLEKSGLRYFTFTELKPTLEEIQRQGTKARQVDEKLQDTAQKQFVKLQHAIFLYQMMKAAARPPIWEDFEKELREFQAVVPAGMEAMRLKEAGKEHDAAVLAKFWEPLSQIFAMARDGSGGRAYPLIIPPTEPEQKHEDWSSIGQGLLEGVRTQTASAPVNWFARMSSAYAKGNVAGFNTALAEYRQWLAKDFARELTKSRQEYFFNETKAFLHCIIIYKFALLLACGALLTVAASPGLSESLRRSAFWLVVMAGSVHTFGLIFRMYLEARPPVTNLYSSAIFIGWGAVVLGIILERFYRVGLGSAVAALTGFITLIIAHNLALGGDTMEMMRAVLDSNFWLATHVVTIAIGYSSTFVAGMIAIAYVLIGMFTPLLAQTTGGIKGAQNLGKSLAKMCYGIVCFATLFSFVGTVLGGIWADQSWGRFWGWDPKENGALIIVLWNALILHARWGGMIRDRGLMNMAIFGNMVTAFSWFGVNMLGIGLHSYGFMDAAFKWLMIFNGTQIAVMILGLLPLRFWRSFRDSATPRNSSQSPPQPAPAA